MGEEKGEGMRRILSFLKGKGWLLLLALLGLLLLLWGGDTKSERTEIKALGLSEAEAYRQALAEEIRVLCESVKGVGAPTVLLTLSSGETALYAKNKTESGESVASPGGDALLLGYAMPKIEGVAVVCRGGGDVSLQAELTALLSASLGIPFSRIAIAEGN